MLQIFYRYLCNNDVDFKKVLPKHCFYTESGDKIEMPVLKITNTSFLKIIYKTI